MPPTTATDSPGAIRKFNPRKTSSPLGYRNPTPRNSIVPVPAGSRSGCFASGTSSGVSKTSNTLWAAAAAPSIDQAV
ncbi:MAG: hypothetical protein EBS69_02595 [Verrucomicrobia bacterium]|nr:hypothetical protein [Verrucomicrobiota bacterium]